MCMQIFAKLMDQAKRSDDFLLHNSLCVKCDMFMTRTERVAKLLNSLNKGEDIIPVLNL